MKNKGLMHTSLNSLQSSNDPSILKARFVVHDFDKSHNNQVIEEEVCRENMATLLNKPIVCKYVKKDDNFGEDALRGHQSTYDVSRDNGEKIPYQDTIAIGTITNVYIDKGEKSNNNVLYCEADMWLDKYYNICSLLSEWIERGVEVSTSVEYIYSKFNTVESVQYVQSPVVYTALCVLNSEDRGVIEKVDPAYDCSRLLSLNEISKWNKAICEVLDKEYNSKEGEVVEVKEKDEVVETVEEVVETQEEKEVEATEEVVEETTEEAEVTEEVAEEVVEEATEEVVEVTEEATEEVVEEVEQIEKSENEVALESKVVELEAKIVALNEVNSELENKLATSVSEKEIVVKQFNEASEMVVSLNAQIEEMKPIVEKYNEEMYNKQLNEKIEYYKEKFVGLNAKEVFETEEVQGLISKSINEQDACFKLNAMLVDLVKVDNRVNNETKKSINEVTTKIENLIPRRALSVEEKYGFK